LSFKISKRDLKKVRIISRDTGESIESIVGYVLKLVATDLRNGNNPELIRKAFHIVFRQIEEGRR
jgi:hypothetical protein